MARPIPLEAPVTTAVRPARALSVAVSGAMGWASSGAVEALTLGPAPDMRRRGHAGRALTRRRRAVLGTMPQVSDVLPQPTDATAADVGAHPGPVLGLGRGAAHHQPPQGPAPRPGVALARAHAGPPSSP